MPIPSPYSRRPLFYDLSSSYIHFWREKGMKAHRWDLFPRISYPMRLFDVLKLESKRRVEGDRSTGPMTIRPVRLNGWKSRDIPEAAWRCPLNSTGCTTPRHPQDIRVCSKWPNGCTPLSPSSVTIITLGSIRMIFPLFDDVDRIPYTNQITYGFTQRFVGKPIREGVESGPYGICEAEDLSELQPRRSF